MLYKFLSGLAKGVTHCIFRVKVVGKENVPKDGGMILAVNHKSNWDPIFAGAYCPRPLRFIAPISPLPRCIGNAPSFFISPPKSLFLNKSAFAINLSGRGQYAPAKIGSQLLLWFTARE